MRMHYWRAKQRERFQRQLRSQQMPAFGTSRQFAATQHFGRFRSEADID